MAERSIIRGVRLGNITYVPGMEDELGRALSPEETDRLLKKGYLEGKWASKPEAAAPTTETATEDLNDLTVAELKDRARDSEISGFSTMSKAELVQALEKEK